MPFSGLGWVRCVAIILWSLSAYISPTNAFFPTAWRQAHFGNNGVSHEQQTAEAFERLALQYWPKRAITRSMADARVAIAGANADVDKDWDHSAFHCDGENFEGAQARLTELKNETIVKLKEGKAAGAQTALGSALHTLQDFYSHSNWVEMGNTVPHPDLGRGRKIVQADRSNATCSTCGPTTQKDSSGCPVCAKKTLEGSNTMLTSGYAFGEDMPRNRSAIPDFKCHHGGFIDNPGGAGWGFIIGMTRGDSIPGINKDSLNCGFSPHSQYHMAAVNLSIKGTMQYIDDIKQQVNDSQFRMLFGIGSTLAFAVDTTSVLKPITSSIKNHAIRIAEDDMRALDNREANQYVVAAFNGGGATAITRTVEFDAFKSIVQGLGRITSPRNSCAGLPLNNILETLKSLKDGSTLYLMAGAYPPDDLLASEIISLAYEKDIIIHSFHYRGGCMNDFIRLRASFKMKSVYDSLATATGGTSFAKGPPQIPGLGRLIQRSKQDHHENQSVALSQQTYQFEQAGQATDSSQLFSAIKSKGDGGRILNIIDSLPTIKESKKAYTFPVDSTITELKFALISKTASLRITHPNGTTIDLPQNERLALHGSNPSITCTDLENGQFITISRPAVGSWKATVEGTEDFTFDVYGTSTLHLHSFDFAQHTGRYGHEGFFPLETPPKTGEEVAMIAEIKGAFKWAAFEFRDAKGKVVHHAKLDPGSNKPGEAPKNSFFGMGKLPKGRYWVYVAGKNEAGESFQRVWREVVQPS